VSGLAKPLVLWEARKSDLARASSTNLLLLHTHRFRTYIHTRIPRFVQGESNTSIHGHPKSTQTIQRTYQHPFHVYETTT
jgi:hypothetical protein